MSLATHREKKRTPKWCRVAKCSAAYFTPEYASFCRSVTCPHLRADYREGGRDAPGNHVK